MVKIKKALGVLCNCKIPLKFKENFYKIMMRPAVSYGIKC